MTKAAIYARFSSEMQNPRSVEDQIALCRSYAEKQGIVVVATFADRARSGASIFGRDGLLSMMEQARTGAFDIVVTEALDRLSRDQEDLAGIYKRLSFAGIKIQAVHDGVADQMQIGIRGLVGALYLQDLSNKVRRGLSAVTRDGRHAGGRAYGYRPVQGKPGELEIVEAEALALVRIFTEFAAGRSPREIAKRLNADHVPPPRGKNWGAPVLIGNKARGYGILVNELYAGTLVWNRVRMVKDPDTGNRVSRPNDRSEWQRVSAPHLRIIDQPLFDQVQQIMTDRSEGVAASAPAPAQRPIRVDEVRVLRRRFIDQGSHRWPRARRLYDGEGQRLVREPQIVLSRRNSERGVRGAREHRRQPRSNVDLGEAVQRDATAPSARRRGQEGRHRGAHPTD